MTSMFVLLGMEFVQEQRGASGGVLQRHNILLGNNEWDLQGTYH